MPDAPVTLNLQDNLTGTSRPQATDGISGAGFGESGTSGGNGGNGGTANTSLSNRTDVTGSGGDIINFTLRPIGGDGGSGGRGGDGHSGAPIIIIQDLPDKFFRFDYWTPGGSGADGGFGGIGGDATGHIDNNTLSTSAGDDNIRFAIHGTGGVGGAGNHGGLAGWTGHTGSAMGQMGDGREYIGILGSSSNPLVDPPIKYSPPGVTGNGGNGGDGGAALSTLDGNSVNAGAGRDSVLFEARSYGGNGLTGGNGGMATWGGDQLDDHVGDGLIDKMMGYNLGGAGGRGGDGGDALSRIDGNTVRAEVSPVPGLAGLTVHFSVEATGGIGGGGGNGGAAGYVDEEMTIVGLGGNISDRNRDFGFGGAGGDGGHGGDAAAIVTNNHVIGSTGTDRLIITALAEAGVSGNGGTGGSGGTTEEYFSVALGAVIHAHEGTTGANGTNGPLLHGQITITGNTFDGGDGNDDVTVNLRSRTGAAVNFSGNTFAGGSGTDFLNFTGLQIETGITVDFAVGSLIIANGQNLISGFEGVFATTGNDILNGSTAAETFYGGDGVDVIRTGGATTGMDSGNAGTGNDRIFVTGQGAVTFNGSDGNDRLDGTQANASSVMSFSGGTGDDTVLGGAAGDLLQGDDGADRILGNLGNDRIYGGAGPDDLYGNGGDDQIYSTAGLIDSGDLIDGGTGTRDYAQVSRHNLTLAFTANFSAPNVRVFLSDGSVLVNVERIDFTGGLAADVLTSSNYQSAIGAADGAATGNNALHGGGGGDSLTAASRGAQLYGDDGNDTLTGSISVDWLYGGTGEDTITTGGAASGQDYVDAGIGNDIITLTGAGNAQVIGGDGNDMIDASLAGLGRTTILRGDAGMDLITGGASRDSIFGGADADILSGGGDIDMLFGNEGDDTLSGGAGDDTLDGGTGGDRMSGGTGHDTYTVDNAVDIVTELAGGGIDTVRTSLSSAVLGANLENLVFTGATAFSGIGNALQNSIAGGSGADTIFGLRGADLLRGGSGADQFAYSSVRDSSGTNIDTILDFQDGIDRIDLSLIDADSLLAGIQTFTFTDGGSFTPGVAGQLIATNLVALNRIEISGDINGDGMADLVLQLAGLQMAPGGISISLADFAL